MQRLTLRAEFAIGIHDMKLLTRKAKEIDPQFSIELIKARRRLKMSQADIANALGVSIRAYWGWETGRVNPYDLTQAAVLSRLKEMLTEKREEAA